MLVATYNIVNGLSAEGEGWDTLLPVDPAVSNPGCTPELLGRETLARLAPKDGEACRKHIKFVTCRTS
jgi:hypothetical protein